MDIQLPECPSLRESFRRILHLDGNDKAAGKERIIGGHRIVYGSRSIYDSKDWKCDTCKEDNLAERMLIFDIPAFKCHKCGQEFRGAMDICLANVKANGIPLLDTIKKQTATERECIRYALSYLMQIMHNVHRACTQKRPVLKSSVLLPSNIHTDYPVNFPQVKSGLHKLLHFCQYIRKGGIFFQTGEYYEVGKTRLIHCDNFEEICRRIADGIPVLATMTTGYKYVGLRYCEFYKAVPAYQTRLLHCDEKEVEGGHIVCLIGAVCTLEGQKGYYAVDAAGDLFCPQFVPEDCTGVPPAFGFGKINAESDFTYNFLSFDRTDEEDPCSTGVVDAVELVDEQESATDVSEANKEAMIHGDYFKKQFAAVKDKFTYLLSGVKKSDDGEAPESSASGSAGVRRSQ